MDSFISEEGESQKEAGVERQKAGGLLFRGSLHSHQTPSVLKDGEPVPEEEGMKKNPPASCPLPPAFRGRSLGHSSPSCRSMGYSARH